MGSSRQSKSPRHFSRRSALLFHLTASVLFLLLLEVGLRLAGFEYHNIPRYVQFADDQYRYPEESKGQYDFVPDKLLFWRMKPNKRALLTNAHGYRGEDFADSKTPGVTRIIGLGCSCTFGMLSSYPYTVALQNVLNRNEVGKRYEVINTGVPGYSSFQGVRLLESEVVRYQPDIITVFFGWNDHWLARYYQDKDQKTPSPTAQFLLDHASRSRLLQALQRLGALIHRPGKEPAGSNGSDETEMYRVSSRDYRRNLETIIDDADKCGARVVLITAPAAFTRTTDVSEHLVRDGFISDNATLLRVHRQYNDIVRQVARSKNVLLIDCAAAFDANPGKAALFGLDGVHPNNSGQWLIALEIFRGFLRQRWIEPGDYKLDGDPAAGLGSGKTGP